MKMNIQFVQMDTNLNVEELLVKRLQKISKKYDWIVSADVFYIEEKDTNSGKGKICEIRLSVPGPRIFASSNEDSLEKATDKTVRDIEVLLKKRKATMKSH